MGELSGLVWVSRFSGSRKTADLEPSFKTAVEGFIDALRSAGAIVSVSSTLRPLERAYLMHHAWRIARENLDPAAVPPMPGVDIKWIHRTAAGALDPAASKSEAAQMVGPAGYNMVHRAALTSRHTGKRAIDMDIRWTGNLAIQTKDGSKITIITTPRDGLNAALHQVAATFGVVKLLSDPPHWSDDGH